MRRPECYGREDAATRIPNPMYASNAGTTPMWQPQSLRSLADAAAKIPNPMYASHEGATRMRQPLPSWRSLANADVKMLNPMYASSSANPPMDQPKTDYQARANDDENTPDATYANIPDDPPMDQPQTDYHANVDENMPDATPASVPDDPPMDQPQTDYQARANDDENKPDGTHASIQDDIRQLSTAVDAFTRDQDDMSATVDALKRGLDNERNRTIALEQRLHQIEKTLTSCPEGYTIWRYICYKAFYTLKNFDDAAATCRVDGGTLAMPRDADTNTFLASLEKSKTHGFWIGLHDRREEGKFEWVDGSALGSYSSWAPGEPNDHNEDEDCAATWEDQVWNDAHCSGLQMNFICQTAPGCP
ncbi:PREDICTED: low affinity immunoglobulin epsilon Fc receptor-like [Branchiostoma belcheri]|uniref:Low affinity immunoglobulin epsilon Fc receptor-like n=1 Tax=Branchiostoma belcheri TaxID=7741 RepID=A0A6P5AIY1_BRABE|nr:PREDICTED: low affinity immunoglobulin epsilon Fc receptor-like [Branchiostoma belcheri]